MGASSTNPGVEPESVNVSILFSVVVVSTVIVIALVAIGWALSMQKFQEVELEVTEMTGYPELHETEMMGEAKLAGFEANDDGTYRIPIERAMELEANEAGQ